MTKVKTANHRCVSVIESGSPNHSEIYIDGEAYDITTLAHKYNKNPFLHTSGSLVADKLAAETGGYSYYRNDGDTNSISGSQYAHSLVLSKETAYAYQRGGTGNTGVVDVQTQHMMDLREPADGGQHGSMKRFTNSAGDERYIWIKTSAPWNWYYQTSWGTMGSNEFSEKRPDYYTGFGGSTANNGWGSRPFTPACVDASGDWIAFVTEYGAWYNGTLDRPYHGFGRCDMDNHASYAHNISPGDSYHLHLLGYSDVNGEPVFMYNYRHNDHQQSFVYYDVSANTTTSLGVFNGAPTASGTSYGGTRGTTTIGDLVKYASRVFPDFTSGADAADKGFYVPYFDTNYDYHPFYYQWDKSTDTFTRNTDITITGNTSSNYISSVNGAAGDNTSHRTVIRNDTHVSGGTRYLTLYVLCGQYQLHDATATARTWVTYSCGASDPKALTHHSTVTIPTTPKNMVYLNDAKTIIGVIASDAFYVYVWDDTNGWELTQTLAERFSAVGRDKTGRIWAVGQGTTGAYFDIHVLSLDVPTKVTVTPASSSYNYTGTTINTSVGVSAYNISNERLATTVKLTIDGTSMQFDSDGNGNAGSDSATITTLTNADVTKNVNIVSAGLSDIIANIEL